MKLRKKTVINGAKRKLKKGVKKRPSLRERLIKANNKRYSRMA